MINTQSLTMFSYSQMVQLRVITGQLPVITSLIEMSVSSSVFSNVFAGVGFA